MGLPVPCQPVAEGQTLWFAASQSPWVGCCEAVLWVRHCGSVTVGRLLWVSRCGFLGLRRLLGGLILLCLSHVVRRLLYWSVVVVWSLWFGCWGLVGRCSCCGLVYGSVTLFDDRSGYVNVILQLARKFNGKATRDLVRIRKALSLTPHILTFG